MSTYKLRSGLTVNLSQKDYVAEGGEGTVFAKGSTAYKVCFPGKMMPEGKVKDLSVLQKDFILSPKDIILDSKGKATGYTMDFIPKSDCYCLAGTFSNTFKNREGLTDDKILNLIKFIKDGVDYVHKQGILIVDLNEFNFLVDKSFNRVYFIDVNSYQTKNYPATAIMPSIQDIQHSKFSTLTDWFSFAIVSFEMLIGIHPFRGGNHPDFQGDLDEKMTARKLANVSILNSRTKFPKNAVRPFNIVPSAYLDWYKKVFEQGERLPPPDDFINRIVMVTPITAVLSNVLNVKEIFSAKEIIQQVIFINNKILVVTDQHVYVDGKESSNKVSNTNIFLQDNEFYSVNIEKKFIDLFNVSRQNEVYLKNDLEAKQVTVINNRVYCQTFDKLYELSFTNEKIHTYQVASVMEHATTFGDGYIVQNIAGANYFILLPESRKSLQVRVKELDKCQIIDGKMVNNVAIIFSKDNSSKLTKNKIVFDEDGDYTIYSEKDINIYDIQLTILDNNLVIETDNESKLVMSKGTASKAIKDNFLESEPFLLTSHGSTVIVIKGNKLFEISLKK